MLKARHGSSNPVKYVDPSGLQRILTYNDWVGAGGHPDRYSAQTLNMISEYRADIIAASTRHYSALQQAYGSKLTDFTFEDFRDTLLALVYTEGWGFYEVDSKRAGGFYNGISGSGLDAFISAGGFSLGVGQIRPDTTALEIEKAGILYQICNSDGSLNMNPTPAKVGGEGYWRFTGSGDWMWLQWADTSRFHRVKRLLDPAWGIEYTAANMHLAVMQPSFFNQWDWPDGTLNRPMSVEERMATWHTQGLFDLRAPASVDDGHGNAETMGELLQNYLHLIYGTKQALLRLQVWDGDWKAQ